MLSDFKSIKDQKGNLKKYKKKFQKLKCTF